ncbi:sugar kinase [Azospirillum doebereinerae]|uniref:2-dehydro-3-deoxygluconokinase n=1 Tax=Azospirillum doebereinerae TaxID=92933 RepID=A0A3S1CH91_9PROT|nr:sugar kinase [Azospirillum doebereinerae]RUQ71451.1 sugar kinase [Azospirillum doebereinerae]
MKRIAAIGECMLELRSSGFGAARFGFGGDTLNCALYLARLGETVDYVTLLGDDPYSADMLAAWDAEGVGTGRVVRLPGRLPGLYAIETDDKGERSFSYWRDRAPARELFTHPDAKPLVDALPDYGLLMLSGISLSLYGEEGRVQLHGALDRARAAGAKVAFDTNLRPRGWPGLDAARAAYEALAGRVDIVLSGVEDEALLYGVEAPEAIVARWRDAGATEVVVKRGGDDCLVWESGDDAIRSVPTTTVERVVDTTAAGDSFCAGYLAARRAGQGIEASAKLGHRLAGIVIGHPGAIVPAEATAGLKEAL